MSTQLEENHAKGDWLVRNKFTNQTHSIHTTPQKAIKKAHEANNIDYEKNLNGGKDNGHTYESPYYAVLASHHYSEAQNPYHDTKTNESVEELDEAIKLPSDDELTKDHLNMLDAEHEKHFNAYHKAKPMSDSSYKHAKKMDILSSQMDHVRRCLKSKSCNEAKTPSLIAGTRKIASFGDHAHTAEVRHNKEFNEYEVHHYKNGVHQGEGPMSFHGDDKDLAIQNAKAEVGLHEDYSEKNPKIDLYHHEPGSENHGKYLTSTKWSPTVKHAVAGYEEKYPEMSGKVKGSKAKGCCESVVEMFESIISGELNESKEQFKSILAEKISYRLDEVKIQVAQGIFAEESEEDEAKETESFHNEHPVGQLKALSGDLNTDSENTVYNKDGSVNKNSGTSKGGRVKDTFNHLDGTKTEVSPNTAKVILSKLEIYKPEHSQRLVGTMHGSKQGWTQAVQEILQDHNSPELSSHKFK